MRRNVHGLAVVFLLAPLLVAFFVELDADNGSSTTSAVEEQGKRLYLEWGCGTCHGEDGGGSSRGPDLRGISAYWKRGLLNEYLKNPGEFRERDHRLRELSRRYFPISMPTPEGLSQRERTLIADYLLSLK